MVQALLLGLGYLPKSVDLPEGLGVLNAHSRTSGQATEPHNMTTVSKWVIPPLIAVGILVAGYKMLKVALRRLLKGRPWEDKLDDWFGWTDPSIAYVYEDIFREPRRWTHHTTNLVVEWTRLSPQRAAKFWCGLVVVQAVAIVGLSFW